MRSFVLPSPKSMPQPIRGSARAHPDSLSIQPATNLFYHNNPQRLQYDPTKQSKFQITNSKFHKTTNSIKKQQSKFPITNS